MALNEPRDAGLNVCVGGKYPSMFGYGIATLEVTRLVKFGDHVTVHYQTERGLKHSDDLDYFCRQIAHPIAYENTTITSVDVTEYFKQHGLTAGEQ